MKTGETNENEYKMDGQNPVANKNYISIGVSVRTINRTARNNGSMARQESNPQSPTVYSSVRYSQFNAQTQERHLIKF